MPQRILIVCPQCQQILRVRPEYLGKRVACNFCARTFMVREETGPDPATIASDSGLVPATQAMDSLRAHAAALERELGRARDKLAERKTRNVQLAEKLLAARKELVGLRVRTRDLEQQLEQVQEQLRLIQEELHARDDLQRDNDRLRAESAALQERVVEAGRLEEVLRAAQDENGRLLSQLGQRDAELEALRGSLEALSASLREELRSLASERDRALAERDRLDAEGHGLASGLEQARAEAERLGRDVDDLRAALAQQSGEKEAVARERDELRRLLAERETGSADLDAELAAERRLREDERAESQARWDRERSALTAEVADLNDRLASLRGEREAIDRDLNDLRVEAERLRSLRDSEETRARAEAEAQQSENARLASELEATRRQRDDDARSREEAGEEVARLRVELERRRRDEEGKARKHLEVLESLRKEWDDERAAWREQYDAACQQSANDARAFRVEAERLRAEAAESLAARDVASQELAELRRLRDRQPASRDEDGPRLEAEVARLAAEPHRAANHSARPELPPRPQVGPEDDAAEARTALQRWLDDAVRELRETSGRAQHLDAEVRAARDDLALLHRDLAIGLWDEEDAAFPAEGA